MMQPIRVSNGNNIVEATWVAHGVAIAKIASVSGSEYWYDTPSSERLDSLVILIIWILTTQLLLIT